MEQKDCKDLKPKAKLAIEMIVSNPELTTQEVADKLGINPVTIYRWKKNPKWKEYEHELCMERFAHLEKYALAALSRNVKGNNQKAVEYVLDFCGYKATDKLEASVDTNIIVNVEE